MKKTCGKTTGLPDEGEPFLQLSKKRAVGWAAIVLFISVWTFVLGVLVGRGTAPVHFDMDRLQQELIALKSQMLEKERETIRKDAESLDSKQAVDFYDVLKEDKVDASVSYAKLKSRPQPQPQPQPKAPVVPVKTAAKDMQSKPKTVPIEKKTVAETPKTPTLENPETAKHVIQVAATRDPAAADQLVARLKKSGYPAFRVVAQNAKKDTWYRVRVGSFSNREEAAGPLAAIRKEYPGALLVNR